MALQAQQLVAKAVKIAKTPGYLVDAGDFLNVVLSELAQLNDFELSRNLLQIDTASSAGLSPITQQPFFLLANDHLHILKDGVFYYISGVPYTLIQRELSDFDQLITTQGFTSQLLYYAVDDSKTPPQIYFWPPPNQSYIVNVRYARLRPDISSPQSSSTVPWFPLQQYLIWETAARLMDISDDDRADGFHMRSASLLRKWLIMQRDLESSAKRVQLDRGRFSTPWSVLPNTKQVGFLIPFVFLLTGLVDFARLLP